MLAVIVCAAFTLAVFAVPMKLSKGSSSSKAAPAKTASIYLAKHIDMRSAAMSIDSVSWSTSGPMTYRGTDGQLITVSRIRSFLRKYRSPMTRYAEEIVAAGIRYRVDPRVVVAISGIESTYGHYAFSYNAWGWGKLRWTSWRAAIDGYTRALGTEYRSLRTGRFAAASRTYCPPCGRSWGVKALRIFRQI